MGIRLKTKEADVQKACLDLLAAERIWAMRINTTAIRTAKGRPIYSHSGGAGVADILATPQPRFYYTETPVSVAGYQPSGNKVLWIECKSSEGKQTREQFLFQQQVEAVGHYYLIVRSVDELRDWLKAHQ